jgi:hypothetical protein
VQERVNAAKIVRFILIVEPTEGKGGGILKIQYFVYHLGLLKIPLRV